jgi:CDGSH-type Zn-finger protein
MAKRRKISITKDGPYIVEGAVPIAVQTIGVDAEGGSEEWLQGKAFEAAESYALCRCGHSRNKPYCDGSHKKARFDGTETASRKTVLEQAQVMDGPSMQLADAEVLCAFARFCDPNGRIWNQVESSDDPKVRANFVRQAGNCASGRLLAIDKATGKPVEPKLPQSIGVVEDPAQGCSGPLWVRGGIELVGADGASYEVRNRMTLCRCGRSENKPFCNGSHAADPKFKDGIRPD